MNRLSRRLARSQTNPTPPRRRQGSGAGLVILCGLIYGLVGFLVTALPPVPWLWAVVFLALGFHLWALSLTAASPSSHPRVAALGSGFLDLLAALGLTISLAVALNYLGSDQLDDITVGGVAGEVILLSLLAVGLALVCRWATAQLSHQLLYRLSLRQMRGVLALIGLIGLALGGTLGLLAVSTSLSS